MNKIRYSIIADRKNRVDENKDLRLRPKVPVGDFPYFADMEYSQPNDEVKIDINFDTYEKRRGIEENDHILIRFGRNTGRIYSITLKNCKKMIEKRTYLKEVDKIIDRLEQHEKSYFNKIRFHNNLNLGREIVSKTLEDRLTDRNSYFSH